MADKHTILMHLKAIGDFQDVVGNITKVQNLLSKLKLPKNLSDNFANIFGDLTKETAKYQKYLDSGFKKKGDITGLESSGERINNLLRRMQKELGKISETDLRNSFQVDPKQLEVLNKELAEAKKNLQEFMASGENAGSLQTVQNAVNSIKEISKTKFADEFQKAFASGNMDAAAEALKKLNANANKFTENSEKAKAYGAAIKILTEQLQSFQGNTSLQGFAQRITEIQGRINNFETDELRAFLDLFAQQQPEVEKLTNGFNNYNNAVKDSAHSQYELGAQISQLKNRALYFLSLTNSVQLFKRALRSALETVKELDATMTEAAVVTDFSIGDMWEKLPEYSKEAQNLGITMNDMYQATTLYYQQGLKNKAAMSLGIETMKMGKIAAMDSTEATKAMTAALRGFNMELNEISAARVNDVYSQLAAITAADTNQIATAMEKTASIASSANMELETTAALLAQIIETTQEAPETAGTALKTIIARFAEVKSLRDQGLSSGEDEEGEAIDVNKIQTALRSVGISMEGFFSGEEGLDSVLLSLAEKWNTLDFETQRYIATMAAGSRQQSRFIAMMSNYERTMELVNEAQNSSGASQEQFQKTQESLATSLNRLHNTWDEFLMGLANEGALKTGINTLTKLLETINKVTDTLSAGKAGGKSIMNLIGVVGALKAGTTLIGGTRMGTYASGVASTIGSKIGINLPGRQGSLSSREWGQAFKEENRKNRLKIVNAFPKTTKYTDGDKQLLANRIQDKINSGQGDQTRLKEIKTQLDEGKISTDKAAESFKDCGGEIEDLGVKTRGTSDILNGIGQTAGKVGIAFMGMGTAVSLLASYFESRGMEEAAEKTQKVAGALIGVGAALSAVSAIMPVLTMLTTAQGAATMAALWPILAVVAGLAALLAIIGMISKARFENSIEGQMQAAAEATEKAKEAAESASQAYDDLLSAREGYSELQTQLESLTKGTLEWKAALAESNNQVLELLETYPELSGYLMRGQHGELEISEAGWDYINEYSANAVANSQAALIASQIDETELRRKSSLIDLEREMYENYGMVLSDSIEGEWVGKEGTFMQELLEEYRENPNLTYESSEALKKYQENEDNWFDGYYGKEEFQEIVLAISKLEAQLKENDKVIEAQTEALIGAQVSSEAYKYDYAKEVVAGISHGYAKNIEASESGYRSRLMEEDKQVLDKLVVDYNIDTTLITEDYNANLAQIYAAMTNQSIDDLDDSIKNNDTYLIKEISKIAASDDAARVAETTIEKMSKMTKQKQQDYSVLLSGDISNATQSFTTIESFNANTIKEELGFKTTDQMLQYLGFDDKEQLEAAWSKVVGLAGEAFESIRAQAKRNGIDTREKDYFSNATHDQLKSYVDLMSYSLTTEVSKDLAASFNSIFYQATPDQRNQIVAAMDSFDWTREGEDEAFVQFLKDIGIELGGTNSALEGFLKQLDMSNAIFRDFDLSDVYDEVKRGLEEAEEIAESDYLSFEQYEKYAKEGLIDTADWTWNGKGWVNIENGMVDLVQALKDNTLSNYKLTVDEAKAQKKWYEDKTKEFAGLESNAYGEVFVGGINPFVKVEELGAYLAQEGLAETIWSQFFATFKEYEQWGKLYKGGFADLETFLAGTETFNPENVILDAEQAWENPYDKFYNTIEKINAELREREKLERAYQRLLKDEASTVQQVLNNSKDQLKNLGAQKGLQQYLMEGKQAEINDLVASSNLKQYATFEDGMIKINWKEIEAVTNEKQGEEIEDYISKLEELRDQYQDAEDALLDIEDQIDEVIDQGKQEYLDLENQIKDAIVNARQEEIDKLSAINETIANSNSKILDSMRQSIEYQRQMRDNQKAEQDLAKKQERLAYLKQSSSGAYDLEIMALEEELAQDQQGYTDSLTDQRLAELEKQNEEARQQRQDQIDILQAQLDYEVNSGIIWQKVEELWNEGIDVNGLMKNSDLETMLKTDANWEGMSRQQKKDWADDLIANTKAAVAWKDLQTKLSDGTISTDKVIRAEAQGIKDHLNQIIAKPKNYAAESGDFKATSTVSEDDARAQVEAQIEKWYHEEMGALADKHNLSDIAAQKKRERLDRLRKALISSISVRQFKTGGLADFTGPAWLDGTKSRPEYILNADQTQAFFKLIDVLSSFKDLDKTSQNSEENVYDIDINVESIDSDYDVDRIAERVKELVLASARYRNNNIL